VTAPRVSIANVVKFLLVCFAVGWVLKFVAVRPIEMWHWVERTARHFGQFVMDIGQWALPYIIVGAGVVVPVIVIRAVYRYMRNRAN
jgi:hypothetical protein